MFRHLDKCGVGRQTTSLQAYPAHTSCNDLLDWVGEEVLKEYKSLPNDGQLQGGERSEGLDEDDDEDTPVHTAVCAFMANNLHKGSPFGRIAGKRKKRRPV